MQNATNKNTEKTADWFKNVVDNCPHGAFKEFRAEVIYRCGWNSRSTYNNKYNGRSELTLSEYAVIKQLAKKHGVLLQATKFENVTI